MNFGRAALLAATLLASTPVPAAEEAAGTRYLDCLATLDHDPGAALDQAEAWTDEGGGVPARHCAGLALVKLGRTAEAAKRFSALAKDPGAGDLGLRTELYSQAGNAWLLSGDAKAAYTAFSLGLMLTPGDDDMAFDRARAALTAGDFTAARADLDRVLAAHPGITDALVLRATARRALGDLTGAASDAEQAVTLAADRPEPWLERGLIRHAQGRRADAVADWRHVLDMKPDSDTAAAAQRLIEDDALGPATRAPGQVRIPLAAAPKKAPPP